MHPRAPGLEIDERHDPDNPAAKSLPPNPWNVRHLLEPPFAVLLEQLPLAESQPDLGGIPRRQAGASDLNTNKLGALWLALFFEPVGKHQAGTVVVDLVGDLC